MNLLLLSNSTNAGQQYMEWCKNIINNFVDEDKKNIIFIPYAAASFTYSEYTNTVNSALSEVGLEVKNIDSFSDKSEVIKNASAIFIGGGNTFHLLKMLQDLNLIDAIRQRVEDGAPYVGWSAGSNVSCPQISTTNDMPIVQPNSFDALKLIPYQINPHYTDKTIPNHGGESRGQRLKEYLYVNRNDKVICLPEASYIVYERSIATYYGKENGLLLSYNESTNLGIGDIIK